MNGIDMEKIDRVIDLTGASYSEVRQALLDHDGDTDLAIVALLRKKAAAEETPGEEKEYSQRGALASDIIESIRELWERGNASTLVIEKNGKELLNLSLTMSSIALVIAPVAAVIGLGAALITEYTIKVVLDDGRVINVNDMAVRKKSGKEDDRE